MRIIYFEDDKYLVLHKYDLIATFDLEIANSNTVRLAWLLVYEKYRGKHYSKRILKEIIKHIKSNSAIYDFNCSRGIKLPNKDITKKDSLILYGHKENAIACSLYSSFGFKETDGIGFNYTYKL